MTNKFVNLGDVNPIEYGGFFIQQDSDNENAYYVVSLLNMSWDCGGDGFVIQDGYVDLSDDWFDLEAVAEFADLVNVDMDDEPHLFVQALWFYYGYAEFQGAESMVDTDIEAIEELEIKGIDLEDCA